MSNTEPTEAQIVAAARVLNKRHATPCNVNEADSWAIQGDDFREDARAALVAALAQPAASGEPADPLHDNAYLRGVALGFPQGDTRRWHLCRIADCIEAATPQQAPARPLNWAEAPRRTEWGAGMMEALIALGPDETLRLYAHQDAVPMADALLSAQPAPARVPLTDAQIDEIFDADPPGASRTAQRLVARAIEAAHGITAPGAPDAGPNAEVTGLGRDRSFDE